MGKKQHYVPVFYLKGFLEPDESYLWVYEKEKQPRKSNPEATAFENYFYAITEKSGKVDVESLEKVLAAMEGDASKVFEKIKNFQLLNDRDRKNFAAFVALMMARVPAFREYTEKLAIKRV